MRDTCYGWAQGPSSSSGEVATELVELTVKVVSEEAEVLGEVMGMVTI